MTSGGKRPGAGRKKSAAPAKLKTLGLRVDRETEAELRRIAKLDGKTLTEWMRDAVMRYYYDCASRDPNTRIVA